MTEHNKQIRKYGVGITAVGLHMIAEMLEDEHINITQANNAVMALNVVRSNFTAYYLIKLAQTKVEKKVDTVMVNATKSYFEMVHDMGDGSGVPVFNLNTGRMTQFDKPLNFN